MANVDESVHGRNLKWWESPKLLGFTVLGLAAIATIILW
jgi:hypothetical protein